MPATQPALPPADFLSAAARWAGDHRADRALTGPAPFGGLPPVGRVRELTIGGPPSLAALCPPPVPAAARRDEPDVPRRGRIRRVGRLLARLGNVVSMAAVAVVGVVMVGNLLGSWQLDPVLSGSMRPGIQPGDLVLVRPEPIEAVKVGQVLMFHPPGQAPSVVVVHRVISVEHRQEGIVVRTKGDANNTPDTWKAVLQGPRAWHVALVIPKVGYVSVFEKGRYTHLAVTTTLVVAGLWWGLAALWRRPADESGDTDEPDGARVP
ncbi:MAG TPA: signal peptidase I [Acidimicrobiales bacterium]|nr:signal peptidase I [Acidimicrobiales bacterium]